MKSKQQPTKVSHRPAGPLRGKKSWREKLQDDKDLPKLVPGRAGSKDRLRAEAMLVPAPREVDVLMRRVPHGRLTTIDHLRAALAARHGLSVTCPITTGIFAWIAAHASEEGAAAGEADVTPYWRTLKVKGEINPKYPGGLEAIISRLEDEGHTVCRKGKRAFVTDFEELLAPL